MKHGLIVIFACFVIGLSGCSSENPLCTTSYCIEGEIYPRSALADGQAFDTWNVDESGLLAFIGNAEPITPPTMDTGDVVPIKDIVSDTKAGNTNYENKVISVNATVKFNFTPALNSVSLETETDTARFIVQDSDAIAEFQAGMAYDFTVLVSTQAHRADRNTYEIYAYLLENSEAEPITLDGLISDVKDGTGGYQGRIVNLTAEVIHSVTTHVSLKTGDTAVDFYIRKTGNGYEDRYSAGQSYDVTLYVEKIDADDLTDIAIWTLLIVE